MENGEILVRHPLLTLFIFWNAVFQERGTVSNAKAPGKARETSKRTDRLIKWECEKNPFMSTRYLFLIFIFSNISVTSVLEWLDLRKSGSPTSACQSWIGIFVGNAKCVSANNTYLRNGR